MHFHNISPIGTAGTLLFLDSLAISATPLGVNSFSANDVSIYPNPAKDMISISNSSNTIFDTIEMTDLNGRVVKSKKINANWKIMLDVYLSRQVGNTQKNIGIDDKCTIVSQDMIEQTILVQDKGGVRTIILPNMIMIVIDQL